MSTSAARTSAEAGEDPHLSSALGKAARHLMPVLVALYFVAFLDRTNVGFAQSGLKADRGVTDAAFALGAGIFFIGYALFEVPSNLLLDRLGARFWLARIAITWGVVAAAFSFVTGETTFVVLRFLLGVTEAGLFPGVILYLAQWFPNRRRVQLFAVFYLAQPFSQVIGSPLSGLLISAGHAITPWEGWQVMFFVQGLLAVLAGVAAIAFLTDSPQQATFLDPDEKRALRAAMDAEDEVKRGDGPRGIRAALLSWKVWYFTVVYFGLQIAVYGTTFYLPQEVASILGGSVGWQVGLVSAIPWVVGLVACYYVGKHATTVVRRRVWGTTAFVVTGTAIVVSAWAGAHHAGLLGVVAITVAVAAFLSAGPITWSYPTAFLTGAAAATGIAVINSLGNLGGFVAPIMRTSINDAVSTAAGTWGVVSLAVFAFLSAAMLWGTRFFRARADELLADEPTTGHT